MIAPFAPSQLLCLAVSCSCPNLIQHIRLHVLLAGTGIDKFGKRFPKRTFDVGIAEQHGVTFAAGMAVEGLKPFCAIYSTFMQRAYDQVVHDVALQQLPVRMILDRAGNISGWIYRHVS